MKRTPSRLSRLTLPAWPRPGPCRLVGVSLRLPSTLPSLFQFSRWWPWGHLRDSGGELRQDVSVVPRSVRQPLWPPCHPGFILRLLDRLHFPSEAVGLSWRATSSHGFLPLGRCPSLFPMPTGWQLLCGQAPICALNE